MMYNIEGGEELSEIVKYSFMPQCKSIKCLKKAGIIKSVNEPPGTTAFVDKTKLVKDITVIECPHCGSALFWKRILRL